MPSVSVGRIHTAEFSSFVFVKLIPVGENNPLFSHDTTQKYDSVCNPAPAIPADHKSLLWSPTAIRCNIKIVTQKGQVFHHKSFSKLEQIGQLSFVLDCKRRVRTKI